MLEHIVLYAEQERLEAERLEAERLEAERLEALRLEQEKLLQQKIAEIQASLDQEQKEAQDNVLAASNELQHIESELLKAKKTSLIVLSSCGILLFLCLLFLGIRLFRHARADE